MFKTNIWATPIEEVDLPSIVRAAEDLNYTDNTWRSTTSTTIYASSNLPFDNAESPLFKVSSIIAERVGYVAKQYGVENPVPTQVGGWANKAERGGGQEYHIHAGSHFSAVFYLRAPENSGNIVFRSFGADTDMFPLPPGGLNDLNFETYSVVPYPCLLVIFRSNIRHMVEANLSDTVRLSLAFNFTV